MERKNDFHLLENLTKKNSRRRLLKRGLALVSVVVLLMTANVLKRNAVAMVGETFCGYDYDHVHSEECFDADGALICDLHVHTDECYEEPTPEEVEVDLSDLEGATEAVEEAEAVVPEAVPSDGTFDLAGSHQVMLSEVLAQTMLPVSRDQIEMVGLVDDSLQGDEAQGEAPVAVAMLEQDVAITALRDFSTAEIAIVTADDIYTIQLMNGAANAEIEAAAEETTEETEETVEETVEENTENIEEIIETTEEEPQEVAAEPAQESEITEAVEEHTEENSEANIEETVEEITAEITDGDEAETEPAEIDETVTGEVVEETVETEEADEETAETEETAEVEETEEAAAEMQAIEASQEAAEAVAEIEETEENTEETAEVEETEENTEETAEIEETEEETEETAEVEETEEAAAEMQAIEASEEAAEAVAEIEETEENTEEAAEVEETEEATEETEEEAAEESEEATEETEEESEEETTEEETAEEESEEESTEEEAAEEKTEEEETTEEESEEESEEEETSEEEAAEEEESEEESEEEETTEEESEEASEEEAAEALDIETLFPAQTFEDHAGNIRVTVTAGVGAFPAGTEMRLTPVWDQETLDGIADSVSEDFVEVKQVLAVDIAFFNAEGEEIEPLLPVSVVMAVEEIEQHQDAVVVHMDDEGNTEVVEQTETAFTEDTERALNVELPAAEDAETQMAQLVEKLEAEAAEQTEAETEPAEAEAADEPAAEAEGVEAVTEEVAIETEEAEPAEETTEVTFEADGFSLYAVVVTETIETRYIAADGATFNISVRYGEDAKIPANATLAVEELTGEATEDYLAQTEELLAEGETITLARYFDITILDAEGNAMQPQAPVSVEVKLADDPADAVQAVHFAEEGAELIDASRNDEEAVTFSAEGFSVYGIVYTVDFYYDVDGKTYEYHIKGGDVLSLKALLPILKVVEEDAAEEFVTNIEDVRFSDESLVKVFRVDEDTTAGAILDALGVKLEAHTRADEAVEAPEEISEEDIDALEAAAEAAGETADEVVEAANPSAALTEEDIEAIKAKTFTAPDWALVSLQPFTSHESLTITLRNGEVVTIRVEDAGGELRIGYLDNSNNIIVDYNRGKFKVGGTIIDSNRAISEVHIMNTNYDYSQATANARRFAVIAKPGYVFDHWEVAAGDGSWHHASTVYTSDAFGSGEFSLDGLRRGENFTAIFVPIQCKMSVDESSRGRGQIRVPWYYTTGEEAEYLPGWRDNWNDGNNRNKDIIEAIPNAGNVFVRWEYYEETKHGVWTRDPSKDLTQQRFNVGEFNLDPNGGKGWYYKAIFADNSAKVMTYDLGQIQFAGVSAPDYQHWVDVPWRSKTVTLSSETATNLQKVDGQEDLYTETVPGLQTFKLPYPSSYRRVTQTNDGYNLLTHSFLGWRPEGGTTIYPAGTELTAYTSTKFIAVWDTYLPGKGRPYNMDTDGYLRYNTNSVGFFVRLFDSVFDKGNTNTYTDCLFTTRLNLSGSSPFATNNSFNGQRFDYYGNSDANVLDCIETIDSGLRSHATSDGLGFWFYQAAEDPSLHADGKRINTQSDVTASNYNGSNIKLEAFPSDDLIFSQIRKWNLTAPSAKKIQISGTPIPQDMITSDFFDIKWYVLKDQENQWHIDGMLIPKYAKLVVKKTFVGDTTSISRGMDGFGVTVTETNPRKQPADVHYLNINPKSDSNPNGYVAAYSNPAKNEYVWVLENLIPLTQYEVKETNYNADGYAVTKSYQITNTKQTAGLSGYSDTANVEKCYSYADDENWRSIQTVDFTNQYTKPYELTLLKQDGTTLHGLANVTFDFSLIEYTDNTFTSNSFLSSSATTTDGNGKITINFPAKSDGTHYYGFTLNERPHEGYQALSTVTGHAIVESDGAVRLQDVQAVVQGDNVLVKTEENNPSTIYVINVPERVNVKVMKHWTNDATTPVVMQLMRNGGAMVGMTVTLSLSNNWSHVWQDLPAYVDGRKCNYTVREEWIGEAGGNDSVHYNTHNDSDGYVDYIVTQSQTETVTGDKTNVVVYIENTPDQGQVKFSKVDENHRALQGAQFTVFTDNACNNIAKKADNSTNAVFTSDDKGVVEIKDMNRGTYYVKETVAPEGYKLDDTVYTLTVKANNSTINYGDGRPVLEVINEEFSAKVRVYKAGVDETTKLAGAEFSLHASRRQSDGSYTMVTIPMAGYERMITGSDGLVVTKELKQGVYFLVEDVAPQGYIRVTEPIQLTVNSATDNKVSLVYNATVHQADAKNESGETVYDLYVHNNPGAVLPSTGGVGTGAYTAIGGALALLAIALMLRKQREN